MWERRSFPFIVGLLLGWIQTGLFFQFSFLLSSGFGTYLLITISWLIGSAVGAAFADRLTLPLRRFLLLMLAAYGGAGLLVVLLPFQMTFWPLYMVVIALIGIYPGIFFARVGATYPARVLFLLENNGFITGVVVCTLLFMVTGRVALWVVPVLLVAILWVQTGRLLSASAVHTSA